MSDDGGTLLLVTGTRPNISLGLRDNATQTTRGLPSGAPAPSWESAELSGDGTRAVYYCEPDGTLRVCGWDLRTDAIAVGPEVGYQGGNTAGRLFTAVSITADGGAVAVQRACDGYSIEGDGPYRSCPIIWSPSSGAIEAIDPYWPVAATFATFYEFDLSQNGRYLVMRSNSQTASTSTDGLTLLDRLSGQRQSIYQMSESLDGDSSRVGAASVSDQGDVLYFSGRQDLASTAEKSYVSTFFWTLSGGTQRITNGPRRGGTVPATGISNDGQVAYFRSNDLLTTDTAGRAPFLYQWTRLASPVIAPATAIHAGLNNVNVRGKLLVGKDLSIKNLPGGFRGLLTYEIQWYAGNRAIKNASKTKLTLTRAMKGKSISVKVTASSGRASKTRKIVVGKVK